MIRKTPTLCRTAALLLAAAALPSTALLAQEAQPPADPPAEASTPAPAPAETAPPADPPAAEAPAPETAAPATTPVRRAAPAPRVRATTTTTRTVRTAPAPAPVVIAPPPAPDAALAPPAELIPPTAAPEVLPEAPPAAVAPAPLQQESRTPSVLPWVLGGFLLLGLAAMLLLRRRRGTTVVDEYDRSYREPVAEAPAYVEEAPPVAVAAAPVAAAATVPIGEPRIELSMRPIRAGMGENDARVEFELTLDNCGNADAQDVRVSTWMLAAGSSEMERALVEPRDRADTPPTTIAAGEGRTVEAAVAMSRGEVEGDSILPVVVADARYRRADGSEGRTSATFAVGVPVDGELAHFDVENPSGLHEGVEARRFGHQGRD
jgi:hypothetical protein